MPQAAFLLSLSVALAVYESRPVLVCACQAATGVLVEQAIGLRGVLEQETPVDDLEDVDVDRSDLVDRGCVGAEAAEAGHVPVGRALESGPVLRGREAVDRPVVGRLQ